MRRRTILKSLSGLVAVSALGAGNAKGSIQDKVISRFQVDHEDEGPNVEIVWDTEKHTVDATVVARLHWGACTAFTQSSISVVLYGESSGSWERITNFHAQADCVDNERVETDDVDLSTSYDRLRVEGEHELLRSPAMFGGADWIPQGSATEYLDSNLTLRNRPDSSTMRFYD